LYSRQMRVNGQLRPSLAVYSSRRLACFTDAIKENV
jgi:hypothetical protein